MSAAPRPAQLDVPRTSAAKFGGFSLIEIMVALVAGMLLAAGIGQVFLSTKQTYQYQDQLSRLQENGRFAMDILVHDIRMAGSMGCGSRVAPLMNTLNGSSTLYYNFATPVQGFEASGTAPRQTYAIKSTYPAPSSTASNWLPPLPVVTPAMIGQVIEGTDVLVLRGRQDQGGNLASIDLATAPSQFTVAVSSFDNGACSGGLNRINGICEGDAAIVADCSVARAFQITAANSAGLVTHGMGSGADGTNACSDWNAPAGSTAPAVNCIQHGFPTVAASAGGIPAEMFGVATTIYYISRRNSSASDPNPGPSLFRRVSTGAMDREELVEGVESLQVLYGVDAGSGGQQFVTADAVAANQTVLSIRVGLLLRTTDEVSPTADANTYDVNGTTVDPVNDRRLRRAITTTIGIRNEFQ
jgi:type IV pilus assembly protein PilW